MTENDLRFIEHVKKECEKHRVKFWMKPVNYFMLSRKFKCRGYFDSENRVLACASKYEGCFEILAHEYCHMQQWLDPNCIIWKKSDDLCSFEKLDNWLSGKNVRNIKQHISVVRDLELDNEKRTAQVIKEFGLSIDLDLYIKKSNAYVHSYNRLGITRKWPNKRIYDTEIVKAMPASFDMDYENYTKEIDDIFERQESANKKTRAKSSRMV